MTEQTPGHGDEPGGAARTTTGAVPARRGRTSSAAPSRAPGWFTVFAIVAAVFLLLVTALLLAGHGPGRHLHHGAASVFQGLSTVGWAHG